MKSLEGSVLRCPGEMIAWRVVSVMLLWLTLGSCGPTDPISRLQLADGRLVGDLTGRWSATVILLYSPTHCFTCDGLLAEWRRFGREADIGVDLVLTAPPTSTQETALAVRRVAITGVLAEGSSTPESPAAYFFSGRTLADSAIGEVPQALLLRELRSRAELVSLPGSTSPLGDDLSPDTINAGQAR